MYVTLPLRALITTVDQVSYVELRGEQPVIKRFSSWKLRIFFYHSISKKMCWGPSSLVCAIVCAISHAIVPRAENQMVLGTIYKIGMSMNFFKLEEDSFRWNLWSQCKK